MSCHVVNLSLCMHIHCVLRSIFISVQHFTSSFSTYSSHAAVVPTRLLIAHPPASALGTYTRWRWSNLFWYKRWLWSILYWYTGWRWSILFSGDVGVEDGSMETVCVDMWLFFPYACIFTAFCVRVLIQSNISHRPSPLTLTRLLIEHPQASALGRNTRWRWSIPFCYSG